MIVNGWTTDFAKKVREEREKFGLYLEGSIGLPKKAEDVPKFEQDVANAKEAGANVLRTVVSSGRRYETYHSEQAFQDLRKAALASLQLAEPVLRKHKVKLGVENHKDFRAPEMVSLIKQVNSEWIGVTLDFGNSMALLEDPMEVVQTLAPYTFSTHVKDMAVEEYPDGFLFSELPMGKGILDLKKIVDPCLTDAYYETFATLPASELARMLRLVKQHKYPGGLPRVEQLSADEKLALEEANIVACLNYSKEKLGLT